MSTDVKFTYSGTSYEYMLASDDNGLKKWSVQQLFRQPPSLLKDKIDMTIKAAASVRESDDDVVTTKTISTVMTQLRTLADGDTITLVGLDAQTYYVTFDPNATSVRSVTDESGRVTEYEIAISCWNLYQT